LRRTPRLPVESAAPATADATVPASSRTRSGAALLAALLLSAACGDRAYLPITGKISERELASRPSIDACLLLLRSDVDPAGELGLTKASNLVDEHEGPFFAKCGYGRRGPWRYVGVEVRRSLSPESAARIQQQSRPFLRRLAREPLVEVADLGEAAVWAGGKLGQLHVLQGDLRLILTIELGDDFDGQTLAVQLARLALDRLEALGWNRLAPAAGAVSP
jgi:hypothetical protein